MVCTLVGRSGLSADFSTACRLPPGMLFVRGASPHSRCPPSPDVISQALSQRHSTGCLTLHGMVQFGRAVQAALKALQQDRRLGCKQWDWSVLTCAGVCVCLRPLAVGVPAVRRRRGEALFAPGCPGLRGLDSWSRACCCRGSCALWCVRRGAAAAAASVRLQ